MYNLQKEQFQQLANFDNYPCISIFMPTNRAGKDVLGEKDRIQLKSLWKKATEKLETKNIDAKKIKEFNASIEEVLKDHDFWRHQQGGLVIFVANDFFKKIVAPIDFEPQAFVSDQFYVKPLLRLLGSNNEFYLLALQIENVRFFKADQHSINEIEIDELTPSRLEERVGFDYEARTRMRQKLSGGKAIMQGDDAANKDRKNEILRYFNAVDAGLQTFLHDEKIPLVVECQDYLFPIYKEANSYQYLYPEVMSGNPQDFENIFKLRESASQLLEPYFNKEQKDKMVQYEELVPERKSADIQEILPAIFEGRVDTLFLIENEDIWGNYNENMASVEVDKTRNSGNRSLLNLAAVKTISQNGSVYLLKSEEMPVRNSEIVAIFRY